MSISFIKGLSKYILRLWLNTNLTNFRAFACSQCTATFFHFPGWLKNLNLHSCYNVYNKISPLENETSDLKTHQGNQNELLQIFTFQIRTIDEDLNETTKWELDLPETKTDFSHSCREVMTVRGWVQEGAKVQLLSISNQWKGLKRVQ